MRRDPPGTPGYCPYSAETILPSGLGREMNRLIGVSKIFIPVIVVLIWILVTVISDSVSVLAVWIRQWLCTSDCVDTFSD